jgi:hypothetical protein
MNKMSLRTFAIATSAFACGALLSFSWSEQRGVSLSVESAQARVGRPLTPMSGAGVARRHYRRGAYGYGAGVVGTGLGAAAIGTAAAVGAAPSPWGWRGNPYNTGTVAPATSAWGSQAYYGAPTANPSGWYIQGGVLACTSGTLVTGGKGLPFRCP